MAHDSSERDLLLARLADEFAARYRRGERPSLSEYVERHPELADDVRDLFPAMVEMEQAKDDRENLSPPAVAPLAALQQLGDFRILREVGRGGMGVVYEAEQISLGRHVALKVMPQNAVLDSNQKQRFEREARTAAKLHHTNIVPVFAVGEHDGVPYYAMQFIQGQSLDVVIEELKLLQPGGRTAPGSVSTAKRAARHDVSAAQVARSLITGLFAATVDLPARAASVSESPSDPEDVGTVPHNAPAPGARAEASLPVRHPDLNPSSATLPGQSGAAPSGRSGKTTYWKSVAQVGIQVAEALAYAHEQGLLHRDVKPSNLLLDRHGTVWVTDFGLAKADDQQNLTQLGDVIGTLRYMPPEAFDGKNDPRSDVYSLGLTLYEMLALRPAFDAADRQRLIRQVTTEPAPPLDRINRHVPRDLVTIVQKAMDREPAHRYATAKEFAADLRCFCADESILARRPTRSERLLRWVRHHPGLAASLAVIALILVAATIVSSVAALSFQQLAKDEEAARQHAEAAGAKERWERYRANMVAAASALQLHNVSAARSALDAAPQEHRNWEWLHFYNRLDTSAHVYRVSDDGNFLAVSPDGRVVAVRCADGHVRLYDLRTRREVATIGKMPNVNWLTFSPDSKTLAYAPNVSETTIVTYDVASARARTITRGEAGKITRLQFSPNGARLLGGSHDRAIRVWDTASGKQLLAVQGPESSERPVSFSADGRRLVAAGGRDRTARVWEVDAGRSLAVLSGHDRAVDEAIFNPQGDLVLTAETYPSNVLRLWEAATGKLVAVMPGHTNSVQVLAFSPDGTRIASGGIDQTIRLWDGRTGKALAVREGHRGWIASVAFSPDGKSLISGSGDHTARIWDAASGAPLAVLHGNTAALWARYTDDGRTIVTRANDETIRLWDARSAERGGVLRGHKDFVYGVAFHPDGERVASASWDGTVRIWDATTGTEVSVLSYLPGAPQFPTMVTSVAFHPAGTLLASRGRDPFVRLWDVASNKEVHRFRIPDNYPDSRLAFSPKGDLLAAGSSDRSVYLWDVERRAEVAMLRGHAGHVRDVTFSRDGAWLASCGEDKTIRIWDLATKVQTRVLGGAAEVYALAVSADGKWLASGCLDGTARIWDTTTWNEIAVLKNASNVHGVAFTPDGTRLACACANNVIRFWDTATHQMVGELHGHGAYVHQIAFSPDGTRLVSASGDFTARVWDTLSAGERQARAVRPRGEKRR